MVGDDDAEKRARTAAEVRALTTGRSMRRLPVFVNIKTRMRFKTLGPEFIKQLQADVRDLLNVDLALVGRLLVLRVS